jgi:MFS family permease
LLVETEAATGSEQPARPEEASAARSGGPPWRRLWDRTLDHYPDNRARYINLGIVVLASIVLYYEFYVQAAVTPSIIAHFGMTWPFFVYVVVVGNLVGAFASLLAGFSDRWGRANLVTYGLLVTGLLVLFGMPNAPNLWVYGFLYALLGFVEGIILVATPALIRDFSPQVGRATAMGFWTMGPVIGSLAVSMVSSHTLNHLHAWQDQFIIVGIVGLVVFVIALVGLRELAPRLRDQLMVSIRDRQLVEARAAGVDVDESLKHPWRQMLHFDVVGSSIGIGVFLIIYYTLIAFLVVYMATIFRYTQQRANALGNWLWAFDAVALVLVGLLSDRIRVRKPFMIVGAAGAIVCTALFAVRATHPLTGYYTFATILSLLAVSIGFVFAPWLAAFTETVEARNPALTATGLAIWGWILRIIVAGSLFLLPYVVTTMTPLVEHGAQVQTLASKYASEVTTIGAIDPATANRLTANPSDVAAIATAVREISQKLNVTPAAALQRLVAVSRVPAADLAYLRAYGPKVNRAASTSPHEWQRWWWICVVAEIVFLPFVFVMKGRWSPKRARQDEEEHERKVQEELAALVGSSAPPAAAV